MIPKSDIEKICKALKISVADFEAAQAAETEVSLSIDESLQSFTPTEIETRDRNKYGEGKKAGEEMLAKATKEKNGVDVAGTDMEKIIDAIAKKAVKDAGINPDEKIVEKDKVINQFKQKVTELEAEVTKVKTEKEQSDNDNELLSYFPANRTDTLTDSEYLSLVKSNYKIEVKDGKKVAINPSTGEVIQNTKDFSPLPLKEVIESHFKSRTGWLKEEQQQQQGRAGKNSQVGSLTAFTKLSEIRKQAEAEGISITGEKFQAMVNTAKKDNPELVID